MVKNSLANAGKVRDVHTMLYLEDLLEEGIATHSSILACRIPRTMGPVGLQTMGSQRLGSD